MLNISKHKFILVQILKDIYSDASIASLLGFKGGTAIYLFYNLPRFSMDLDFNLLDISKKDVIFKRINNILQKYGKLKEAREKRFTLFSLLSYDKDEQNIKVEISKRVFPNSYEIKNYLGISMLVLKKKDMFAHKLVALIERRNIANRDIFDIWFFMKNNWGLNKQLVELRTKIDYKKCLKECISKVEKVDERYILQGLGEILDKKRKSWAKKNLKKETLFLLKFYLKNQ